MVDFTNPGRVRSIRPDMRDLFLPMMSVVSPKARKIFAMTDVVPKTNGEKAKAAIALEKRLVQEFKYKPVPITLETGDVRACFERLLPDWCEKGGDSRCVLCSHCGTDLFIGYDRVVVGDYGAFFFLSPECAIKANMMVKPGQEYRTVSARYDKCKYIWLTARDASSIKIYFQKNTVSYADYRTGKLYVSPHEVIYKVLK